MHLRMYVCLHTSVHVNTQVFRKARAAAPSIVFFDEIGKQTWPWVNVCLFLVCMYAQTRLQSSGAVEAVMQAVWGTGCSARYYSYQCAIIIGRNTYWPVTVHARTGRHLCCYVAVLCAFTSFMSAHVCTCLHMSAHTCCCVHYSCCLSLMALKD